MMLIFITTENVRRLLILCGVTMQPIAARIATIRAQSQIVFIARQYTAADARY